MFRFNGRQEASDEEANSARLITERVMNKWTSRTEEHSSTPHVSMVMKTTVGVAYDNDYVIYGGSLLIGRE